MSNVMGPRLLLDTNVWRMLIDADRVLDLRSLVKAGRVEVLVAPAVVYEIFRNPNHETRRRQIKAITLSGWTRLMTEIFDECAEKRDVIGHHRPQWLRQQPDLKEFSRLRADWSGGGGFWRRARKTPEVEWDALRQLEGNSLDLARAEARRRRKDFSPLHFDSVQLNDIQATPNRPTPGWRGDQVEPWRLEAAHWWWRSLIADPQQAVLDWLEPFLDLPAIARDRSSWTQMWLYEVRQAEAPREWMRWAVAFLQALRKVTAGTPADNQIALYAYQADVFLSADKGLVDITNKVRVNAPAPMARAHRILSEPDPVAQVEALLQSQATTA